MANGLEIRSTLEDRHHMFGVRNQPDYQACPSCDANLSTIYNKPLYGAPSGHFERTGECRNCGPVTLKSGPISGKTK